MGSVDDLHSARSQWSGRRWLVNIAGGGRGNHLEGSAGGLYRDRQISFSSVATSDAAAPHVAFLRAAMKHIGCPREYDVNNVHCVSCPQQIGGGYHPPSQQVHAAWLSWLSASYLVTLLGTQGAVVLRSCSARTELPVRWFATHMCWVAQLSWLCMNVRGVSARLSWVVQMARKSYSGTRDEPGQHDENSESRAHTCIRRLSGSYRVDKLRPPRLHRGTYT
jgi:hypothetical protein